MTVARYMTLEEENYLLELMGHPLHFSWWNEEMKVFFKRRFGHGWDECGTVHSDTDTEKLGGMRAMKVGNLKTYRDGD